MVGLDNPVPYEYVRIVTGQRRGTGVVWIHFEVRGHPAPLVAEFRVDNAKRLLEALRGAIAAADPTSK